MKYSTVLLALVGSTSAHHHHHHHSVPVSFAQGKPAKEAPSVLASGDGGAWTPADSRKTFDQHVSKASQVVKTQDAFEKK